MDTRVLSVVAVVVAAISGGYYYYSGKAKKLDIGSALNMSYSSQDEGLADILDLHTQEELTAEVEAGSRPYDSAFVLREE